MKPRRRFKRIWVDFISLVDEGANRRTVIWKSVRNLPGKDPLDHTFPILKIDDDQRMVYGIVYAPDEVDTDGDVATAEVIKETAYRFMREKQEDLKGKPGEDKRTIDKQHNAEPDQGYVAESWIVRKNDALFPNDVNAWAVGIKVEDEDTWQEIKKGKIRGLSMGGEALAEDLEKGKQEDVSMDTQKIVSGVVEGIKKAFVSFTWSGSTGEQDAAPTSIKDDLSALLKDVDSPEQAKAVIEGIGKFNEQLTADVKDLLKDVSTASPASPALDTKPVVDPPVKDPKDGPAIDAIAKSVADTVSAALKPLSDAVVGVTARLDTLEKTGVGRQTGLPIEGEPEDNGKPSVRFTGVEVPD